MTYFNPEVRGGSITIKDEGVTLTSNATSIDFVGAGVTGTVLGSTVTETIPGGTGAVTVVGETPSGVIDGNNVTFTLANTPIAGTLALYNGGGRLKVTEDYTLVGLTITFNIAPMVGSILLADYQY